MARTCSICSHANRDDIDRLLVDGASLRDIAGQFSVSRTALSRHQASHLPASMTQAAAAVDQVRADTLLGRLRSINAETAAILREARSGDPKDNLLALRAIARVEKQIELEARLLGELQDGTTVNVSISPEWVRLRSAILSALAPFPEARVAVAEAMRDAGA